MKTFVLILAMLATPLVAQKQQPPNTVPPQTAAQSASGQAAQHPQTVVKPTAKPVQPHSPQQLITFTAKELDEHDDKILDRSEAFYNNRMTHLLWTMGILVGIGAVIVPLIVGVLLPIIMERQRKTSFNKEMDKQSRKFEKALAADSAIHFMEHAKNLPNYEGNAIDAFCLLLLAANKLAKTEEISGIHECFDAINLLQLPKYSMGRDIKEEHARMLSRYDMLHTAIRESGFEQKFKTQLKSIETKIKNWYSNFPENKKSE